MRMRYSRTKTAPPKRAKSVYHLKLCRFASLATARLALRVCRTLPKRQLRNSSDCRGRLSNNPRATNVDSTAAHVRRRPHCEHDNFVSESFWETQCKNSLGTRTKTGQCCGFGMVFSACQFARCISYSCCSHPTL